MLIKNIKLGNIRSYTNHEISFPEGSVLLSGDIGSGKSSILLAIDFVLFGLRRGDLSGSMLLRNGKNSGFVELTFNVLNKEVTVRRNLKRVKGSIVQDSGYIVIDGKKKEASALELKQIVLELLNYPMDLLTKSKPLVYHYTVYTPQEEMKHILYAENEVRLDTLRKVFGIDKYKRIKENSNMFLSKLRELMRELELRTSDLKELEKEKDELGKEVNHVKNEISKLEKEKTKFDLETLSIKRKFEELDKKRAEIFELKSKRNVIESKISNSILEFNEKKKISSDLISEVDKLKKELIYVGELSEEDFKIFLDQKQKDIGFLEGTLSKLNYKLSEFNIKKSNSIKIIENIKKLDICPVCKQRVGKGHKDNMISGEDLLINECGREIAILNENIKDANKNLNKFKEEFESLKDKLRDLGIIKIKRKNLVEKEKSIVKIDEELKKLKKETGKLSVEKNNLKKEISSFDNIEGEYNKLSVSLDEIRNKIEDIVSRKGGFNSQLKQIQNRLDILIRDYEKKQELVVRKNKIVSLKSWIENGFIPVIGNIERSIMLKVHHDFSNLFEKWFNTLVDTENLTVKLDEDFTPLIEQDGFKIDFECLSGGEKTAAALAYRLSLNQVINHVMGNLNTKDIIILDEPTDGFSEDQIDRMRNVLEELKLRQIIIVSHESKIESFVQNVIKLNKRNHVTEIMHY